MRHRRGKLFTLSHEWILMLSFLVSGKKRLSKFSSSRLRNSRATFGTQGRLGRWPGIFNVFSRNISVPPSRTCRVSTITLVAVSVTTGSIH